MKILTKTASVILGLTLASVTTVSAAGITISCDTDEKMTVKGSDFIPGSVAITVAPTAYDGNYGIDTPFVAVKEVNADTNGNFTFEAFFPQTAPGGYYTAAAYGAEGEIEEKFFFVNPVLAADALDAFAQAKTSGDVQSMLTTYADVLGISEELASEDVNRTRLASLMLLFKPSGKADPKAFVSSYLGALLAGAGTYTAEQFLETIENNAVLLGCQDSPFMNFEEDQKKDVHSKLASLDISSNSFADALLEAAFLSEINREDITRSEFETLITEEYAEFLGIDTDSLYELKSPDKVISALLKKNYTSAKSFVSNFKSEVSAQEKAERKTTGGSGGGGGGGVSASGSYDAADNAPVIAPAPDQGLTVVVFDDMKGHWANDAVNALKSKGIVDGVGNNLFEPDRRLTRAEFAKIIAQSFFADKASENAEFTDVSDDDWFAPFVYKLAAYGIVGGVGDGSFAPYAPVTRQDAAVIMYRTAKVAGISLDALRSAHNFGDDIADYAAEAVDVLYTAGYINGMDAYTFGSFEALTRAQASQLVYNMIK